MTKDAKGKGKDAPDTGKDDAATSDELRDEKWQTEQEKEVEAMFAAVLALRDKIRIMDAEDRDRAGNRSIYTSEGDIARVAAANSVLLLHMIREFAPNLSLIEMHQVKDLLYGLMTNLLRFQYLPGLSSSPLLSRPEGSMTAIRAAARILCDIPTDEGKQLAHCLRIVETFTRRMLKDREQTKPWLYAFRDQLSLECDERFETLPFEFLFETLHEIAEENVKGRGKIRIVGAAAQLAIKVGAWGFDELASDSKKNFDLARERFSQAQKRERKHRDTVAINKWEKVAAEQTDLIKRFELWAKENGRELDDSYPRLNRAREELRLANEQLTMLRNKKQKR